jgi:hypothetical protein
MILLKKYKNLLKKIPSWKALILMDETWIVFVLKSMDIFLHKILIKITKHEFTYQNTTKKVEDWLMEIAQHCNSRGDTIYHQCTASINDFKNKLT